MPDKKPVHFAVLMLFLLLAGFAQPVSADQHIQTYTCNQIVGIPPDECQVLQTLFDSTNGANWANTSGLWFETTLPANWYGVTVFDGRVQAIELLANDLNGTIPSDLGNLTELVRLNLYDNQLSGAVPASLGLLTKLEFLDLGKNQLSGSVPAELGNLSLLDTFSLEFNQLTGALPSELGNMSALFQVYLNDNQFSGSIPASFGNLSQLVYLELQNNQLTGSIPSQLGDLSQLLELKLDHNQLSGTMPAALGSLSNLQVLWLNDNALQGSIPASLASLTSLKAPGASTRNGLDLDYNNLLVPWNYPSPGDPLHTFLTQKDPNWHLRQNSDPQNQRVFLPIIVQ